MKQQFLEMALQNVCPIPQFLRIIFVFLRQLQRKYMNNSICQLFGGKGCTWTHNVRE